MWDFIVWLKDGLVSIVNLFSRYEFDIAGVNVSILELFIGFIAMGIIITVFWKGAHD